MLHPGLGSGSSRTGSLAEAAGMFGRVNEMLVDKAFCSDEIRNASFELLDALPVFPNRSNRAEPYPWNDERREHYKVRNRIERALGLAKPYR